MSEVQLGRGRRGSFHRSGRDGVNAGIPREDRNRDGRTGPGFLTYF